MRVKIYFDDGPSLTGHIDMKDLFNKDRFIAFTKDDIVWLINKDHIVQVRPD